MKMTRPMDSLVFVYGTLKRGFLNYHNYLKPAVVVDKARYMCDAVTARPDFRLVLTPSRKVPCLYRPIYASRDGYKVSGELFSVDADALNALDLLEGVDQGSYCRERIEIELTSDGPSEELTRGRVVECETYVKVYYDELETLKAIPEYTEVHHVGLIPHVKTPELRVLACVYGPQVTDKVQEKMDQGLDFDEAWRQVVGAK